MYLASNDNFYCILSVEVHIFYSQLDDVVLDKGQDTFQF